MLYDQRWQNPRAGGSDAVRAFWETWAVHGDGWMVPCQAGKERLESLPNEDETKHLVVWTVEVALSVHHSPGVLAKPHTLAMRGVLHG